LFSRKAYACKRSARNLRLRERPGEETRAQGEEIYGKALFNLNNGQTGAVKRKLGSDGHAAASQRMPPEDQ
jgi:hypothetical protein